MFWHFKLSHIIILLFYGGIRHGSNRYRSFGSSATSGILYQGTTLWTLPEACFEKKQLQKSHQNSSGFDFELEWRGSQLSDGGSHWAGKLLCWWGNYWCRNCGTWIYGRSRWQRARREVVFACSQEWAGVPEERKKEKVKRGM